MLNKLPNTARVWIFQANRFLTDQEKALIHHAMQQFIPSWAAHGKGLSGDYELEENLFLIIGVDEAHASASGCSIDTLTHKIKELGALINVDFFDRLNIAYLNANNQIDLIGMGHFKNLMAEDKIGYATKVFNNLVETKGDLIANWRTTVKNSWHKNLIQIV